MEFGISTFGEIEADKTPGNAINAGRRVKELIEEAKLADAIGLDVYALGEHHRSDYVVSSPEVILSAIAAVTQHIRLSSAVTVLSSADPVRVFQNFATLDLVSGGRAEIMAGRGSFIESFPLFGYDLKDYDELFTEKLDLLLAINKAEKLSWKGHHRASISSLGVYPRPWQPEIAVFIAVGGTPASVVRAGSLNLPVVLAILGGAPEGFVPLVELYRTSAVNAGHDASQLKLTINEHVYIADSSEQASDEFWPIYEKVMNRVGRERGWAPITRAHFEQLRSPRGPLLVGNVQEVKDKLVYQYGLFKNTRFLAQVITGNIDHGKIMRSIELFGKQVVPAVKEAIALL